jgi:hypothetical protein
MTILLPPTIQVPADREDIVLSSAELTRFQIESARKYWSLCNDEKLRSTIGAMNRDERDLRLASLQNRRSQVNQLADPPEPSQRMEIWGLHAWYMLESHGLSPQNILLEELTS